MALYEIENIRLDDWDKTFDASSDASFFHSSDWIKLFINTYHYRPHLLLFRRNGNSIALLPILETTTFSRRKKGVALPFSDSCAPIILDRSFNEIEFFETLEKYRSDNRWTEIEIRGGTFPGRSQSKSFAHHRLDLSGDENAHYERLKPSNKRNIKTALNHGVVIRRSHTRDSLKEFYRLNCMTRRKHGLPPQPFGFFKSIEKYVLDTNKGDIFTAVHRNKTIAASIFLHRKDSVIYKYGASDPACLHLRANNLLMWEAIAWYRAQGYVDFSFGRTDSDQEGLINFKDSFGSTREELSYYTIPGTNTRSGTGLIKSLHPLVSRMPLWLLKIIGALLYKYMG